VAKKQSARDGGGVPSAHRRSHQKLNEDGNGRTSSDSNYESEGSDRSATPSAGKGPNLNRIIAKSLVNGLYGVKRRQVQQQQPAQKIEVDKGNIKLKAFFYTVQNKTKLDPERLFAKCKVHFEEQNDLVFPIIKRVFGGFRQSITYKEYCQYISKFINIDFAACKELFFHYVDFNKDNQVSETDLF